MQSKCVIKLRISNKVVAISMISIIAILYFCRTSFFRIAILFNINTGIVAGLITIPFLMAVAFQVVKMPKSIPWDGIFLVLGVLLFFGITILVHPEYKARFNDPRNNGAYSAAAVFSFGSGIYTYFIIRLFRNDREDLYKTFRIIAYVLFFFNLLNLLRRDKEYDMAFGYQMEFAAILFIGEFLYKKHRIGQLILSLLCMLLAVLYGSRAVIVGYVFFIAVFLLWQGRINKRSAIIIMLGIAAAIVLNSRSMLLWIYNLFSSMGLPSRTLYYLAQGNILAADTARQEWIWPELIQALKNSSFFEVHGAYGDRYLMSYSYIYAHNFILEILLTFGKFLGGLLLLWIAYRFIKVCLNYKGMDGMLTIVFGCFSLCKLFFSSSFWYEPYFWAFIAMLVNCYRGKIFAPRRKRNGQLLKQGSQNHGH